jgi:DNA-binding GntR family transcriptional regulator
MGKADVAQLVDVAAGAVDDHGADAAVLGKAAHQAAADRGLGIAAGIGPRSNLASGYFPAKLARKDVHMVTAIQRPASLAEMALRQIRTAIVEGVLPLGSAISEAQLAASLGISKTPVREALTQLRVEGLITIVPQSGTYVFTLSAVEVMEICELRQMLEVSALRLAMKRNHERLVRGLAEVCRGMDEARDRANEPEYLRLDSAFHEQFFVNCSNRYIADVYARLAPKIAALRTHISIKPDHNRLSYPEHKQILETVCSRDEQQTIAILERHIDRTRTAYKHNIEDIAAADRAADEFTPRSRKVGWPS